MGIQKKKKLKQIKIVINYELKLLYLREFGVIQNMLSFEGREKKNLLFPTLFVT